MVEPRDLRAQSCVVAGQRFHERRLAAPLEWEGEGEGDAPGATMDVPLLNCSRYKNLPRPTTSCLTAASSFVYTPS